MLALGTAAEGDRTQEFDPNRLQSLFFFVDREPFIRSPIDGHRRPLRIGDIPGSSSLADTPQQPQRDKRGQLATRQLPREIPHRAMKSRRRTS